MALMSIITASFNSEDVILETYESIKAQSYIDWEWLVTDDCSVDETLEILRRISAEDPRVRFFKNAINSGAAASRNNSLKYAEGRFITFIDSDDLWVYNKLEKQLSFMVKGVDFSFTAYSLIDKAGKSLGQTVDANHKSGEFSYKDMLRKKATMGCSTVMIRSDAFEDLSMPLLRTGQDYATWLKLLKTGKKAHLLREVLTMYRIMPNSISRNKFKKAMRQWSIYRDVECIPLFQSAVCFSFYVWRAIFRQ